LPVIAASVQKGRAQITVSQARATPWNESYAKKLAKRPLPDF
jgi:hypothetical protein